ncbi:MAG: multiheme c-type cytochrome [Byssovorax sp.]
MIPGLRRKLGWLERGAPWLALSAIGALVLGAAAALAAAGRLDGILAGDSADHALRGYTPFGLFLGIAATLLTLIAVAYSLRKRPLQERLPSGRGSMTLWLWLHVAAGLVAIAAVLAHAGYGLLGTELSTGKILFAIFALLSLSGVAWRVVYQVVPPAAAPKIGDYSERASDLRAEEQLIEIEKIAAGGSADLHRSKTWLIEAERSSAEIAAALAPLNEAEREKLMEIQRLADSRRRGLARKDRKARTTRLLQAWRLLHIPLALALPLALLAHIVGALDLPAKAFPPGDAPFQAIASVHPSKDCGSCHRRITEQWASSMHAHALRSPVTVAQNNQLVAAELGRLKSPDPRRLCVNCHGPLGVALAGQSRLPLSRAGYDDALLNEGIGCSTCHQYEGESSPGSAGLTKFQDGFRPGAVYRGEIDDPVGNAFHQSAPSALVKRDGGLCANCHSVEYDVDGDGKLVKGLDLVLQTTTEEFAAFAASGGKGTCVSCHMPALAGATRVAERASLVSEQDHEAPPREVHDHSFTGVDYPLDEVARKDPNRPAREALLRGAARLDVDPAAMVVKAGQLSLAVAITNIGVGHNLPSGFAFARQMWLEVRVVGEGNRSVFTSGVLARASDDLCDAGTLDDPGNPVKAFVVGCKASDPQLVSFQQKLVDHIDVERDAAGAPKANAAGDLKAIAAKGASEAWIQHLAAGAIPRVRPSDGVVLAPITPNETRTHRYLIDVRNQPRVNVTVRLLFRSIPPSMLRALGSGQAAGEIQLAPLVENLQIVEMATRTLTVDLR